MEQATMDQFTAMRADIEGELTQARAAVVEAEADAAAAEAARLTALADRDAMQAAISPLGETVLAPIALRLGDMSRALSRATGDAIRARLIAEASHRRVTELEDAIAQIERLIDPPPPDPELIEGEAA